MGGGLSNEETTLPEEENDGVDSSLIEEENDGVDSSLIEEENDGVDSSLIEEENYGGDSSLIEEENDGVDSSLIEEENDGVDSSHTVNASSTAAAEESFPEAPAELPQCLMGNRKVDDMCFMISCTNWY